ncbi:MAG: DUF3035 domain-containing protein [Paracoccaceae bacterium]
MRLAQIVMIVAACGLTACGSGGLRELTNPGEGPDEFLIVPGKPLQSPDTFATLPQPTPGGSNRTDLTPLQDSAAELGGQRRVATSEAPRTDGGVINYVSRFGRDGGIRQTLATEDEAFRKRRGRFTQLRIGRRDRYKLVYERQSLDAQAEQRKWRRAGARTPSAPPE